MIPTQSRAVHVMPWASNGTVVQAAIITRVHAMPDADTAAGPVMVNLTVLPDCAPPTCCSSVLLFDTQELAEQHLLTQHVEGKPVEVVAFWPPRV